MHTNVVTVKYVLPSRPKTFHFGVVKVDKNRLVTDGYNGNKVDDKTINPFTTHKNEELLDATTNSQLSTLKLLTEKQQIEIKKLIEERDEWKQALVTEASRKKELLETIASLVDRVSKLEEWRDVCASNNNDHPTVPETTGRNDLMKSRQEIELKKKELELELENARKLKQEVQIKEQLIDVGADIINKQKKEAELLTQQMDIEHQAIKAIKQKLELQQQQVELELDQIKKQKHEFDLKQQQMNLELDQIKNHKQEVELKQQQLNLELHQITNDKTVNNVTLPPHTSSNSDNHRQVETEFKFMQDSDSTHVLNDQKNNNDPTIVIDIDHNNNPSALIEKLHKVQTTFRSRLLKFTQSSTSLTSKSDPSSPKSPKSSKSSSSPKSSRRIKEEDSQKSLQVSSLIFSKFPTHLLSHHLNLPDNLLRTPVHYSLLSSSPLYLSLLRISLLNFKSQVSSTQKVSHKNFPKSSRKNFYSNFLNFQIQEKHFGATPLHFLFFSHNTFFLSQTFAYFSQIIANNYVPDLDLYSLLSTTDHLHRTPLHYTLIGKRQALGCKEMFETFFNVVQNLLDTSQILNLISIPDVHNNTVASYSVLIFKSHLFFTTYKSCVKAKAKTDSRLVSDEFKAVVLGVTLGLESMVKNLMKTKEVWRIVEKSKGMLVKYAVKSNKRDMVRCLVEMGIGRKDVEEEMEVLRFGIEQGFYGIVEELVERRSEELEEEGRGKGKGELLESLGKFEAERGGKEDEEMRGILAPLI